MKAEIVELLRWYHQLMCKGEDRNEEGGERCHGERG